MFSLFATSDSHPRAGSSEPIVSGILHQTQASKSRFTCCQKAACLVLWFLVMFVLERLGDFRNRRLEDVGVDQDTSREKESPLPSGWDIALDKNGQALYFNTALQRISRTFPDDIEPKYNLTLAEDKYNLALAEDWARDLATANYMSDHWPDGWSLCHDKLKNALKGIDLFLMGDSSMLWSFKFWGYVIEKGEGSCFSMNADDVQAGRNAWEKDLYQESREYVQRLKYVAESMDFSMTLSYLYALRYPKENTPELWENFWNQDPFDKKFNVVVFNQGMHLMHTWIGLENFNFTKYPEQYWDQIYDHYQDANCIIFKTTNPIVGEKYSGPYANYWRNQNEKNDAYKRDIDQCIDNIHDEEICLNAALTHNSGSVYFNDKLRTWIHKKQSESDRRIILFDVYELLVGKHQFTPQDDGRHYYKPKNVELALLLRIFEHYDCGSGGI